MQGCLWGEYLPTPERVSDMAFPRFTALAELANGRDRTSYGEFVERARAMSIRLSELGIRGRAVEG